MGRKEEKSNSNPNSLGGKGGEGKEGREGGKEGKKRGRGGKTPPFLKSLAKIYLPIQIR